jgi:glycosyltransferase involved in cell wall biosynthesis
VRILHVTPYYEEAWAYGGIPRAVTATVRGLAARGHDVTVCTTDACRPQARVTSITGQPSGVNVRMFPNVSNRAAYHLQLFTPLGMRRFLRQHAGAFDVAHLHGCHHLPGAMAARRLRQVDVPYVVTPHGTAPYLERRRVAKRVFDLTLGRGVLKGASSVIAVSEAERDQLVRFGVDRASIEVIPNPLDVSEFDHVRRGAFRRAHGIRGDVPLIVFLGKLTAQKRLDVLVHAFSTLATRDARLVIAGNDMGYGRAVRARVAAAGLRSRVSMPGLLAGPARVSALADADVVVYASEGEVFGLVPIEALLCGTPVIVSNDSGCGEVISGIGGGLLVPPGDHQALAVAIDAVLANRAHWRREATVARERARRYAASHVCERIERAYARVAHQRGESLEAVVG